MKKHLFIFLVFLCPIFLFSQNYYTIGSTKDEVLSIQGTPTSLDFMGSSERWYYGSTYVSFENGKVESWSDSSGRKLKVKMR